MAKERSQEELLDEKTLIPAIRISRICTLETVGSGKEVVGSKPKINPQKFPLVIFGISKEKEHILIPGQTASQKVRLHPDGYQDYVIEMEGTFEEFRNSPMSPQITISVFRCSKLTISKDSQVLKVIALSL